MFEVGVPFIIGFVTLVGGEQAQQWLAAHRIVTYVLCGVGVAAWCFFFVRSVRTV